MMKHGALVARPVRFFVLLARHQKAVFSLKMVRIASLSLDTFEENHESSCVRMQVKIDAVCEDQEIKYVIEKNVSTSCNVAAVAGMFRNGL